jgi:hypothetical protein
MRTAANAFGHLDDGALLRAMAGALREYQTPNRADTGLREEPLCRLGLDGWPTSHA